MPQIEHSSCIGLRPIPDAAPEWVKKAIIEARASNKEIRTSPDEEARVTREKRELKQVLLAYLGPQNEMLPIPASRRTAPAPDTTSKLADRLRSVSLF